MPIPDFQTLMLPVLRTVAGEEVNIRDVIERLAAEFSLTADERAELNPSSGQTKFYNRVQWAKSYLGKAGLIELTGRGRFRLTQRGRDVFAAPPARITISYLRRFAEFQSFRPEKGNGGDPPSESPAPDLAIPPDEAMRQARDQLEDSLGRELLARILAAPPSFFERLIVLLLKAMGYGGPFADAGRALGHSGDGGLDGVIDEDALGLDRIYVQAKRYAADSPVGPSAIRDFFGALDQVKAGKGLFVTTSGFTPSALKTSEGLSKRIVLIDGKQLARLMVRYGVGCRVEETLHIKRLDDEFFET